MSGPAHARLRPDSPHPPAVPRIFPGWLVVAGAFLVTMTGYGAIYSYAVFAEEIGAAFGSSRGPVSVVYGLSGGASLLVGVLTGPLADRIGARVMAAIGMLLVGLGFLVAAAATSLSVVWLGYGLLVGLGVGCAYVPAVAAVQQWFTTHRGLASGLAVSGIGVGTALLPALADVLGALGDWRAAFAACGVLCAAVGVAGALLLRPAPVAALAEATARPLPPRSVLGRDFRLAWLGTLLAAVPAVLPHALLVSTARDLGLDRGAALELLGLIGVGTIVGRFLLAAIADVLGRRAVFLACCTGMALSMPVWALGGSEAVLQAFALGFGGLQGGFVALLPAFVADSFGARSVGGLLGVLYTGRGIALLAAPPALAAAMALAGGHVLPLLAAGLLGLAGALLLALVRRAVA
jgi:MFS family permease